MITFKCKGNFSNTNKFLEKAMRTNVMDQLQKYGERGVNLLRSATPIESGHTADSWYYEITKTRTGFAITWHNSHIVNGVNIAIILQYGHGTRNGGWVEGRDYINSTMQPIFDEMANIAWKEVTR